MSAIAIALKAIHSVEVRIVLPSMILGSPLKANQDDSAPTAPVTWPHPSVPATKLSTEPVTTSATPTTCRTRPTARALL